MKKLLLTCFLALGFGANAQFNFNGDFEIGSPATDAAAYGQFGGGTITAAAACAGSNGGQLAITTASTGWMVQTGPDYLNQVSNGLPMTISASWKKGAGPVGTLSMAYFLYNPDANNWTIYPVGTPVSLTAGATTACAPLTATIPAGVLQPDKIYAFGVWFTRNSASGTGNVFVDDINGLQETPTAPPATCATVTNPVAGSTIPAGALTMKWNSVAQVGQYKVSVSTTPTGAPNVYNGTVTGTSLPLSLTPNTTYYASVIPTNALGDATGCTQFSFTTNTQIAHCGPLSSSAPTAIAPIKSVNFAGVTNTSDPTATTIGSFPVHQDFTSVVFPVQLGSAAMPLTIQGTTNGNAANGWAMSVFIDWNNDGDFDDAGEQYFNTTATMIRKAGVTDNPTTLTGNITIPTTATVGTKKMRIKYNFSGTSINTPLTTGCADMINGQVEDYTINLTNPSAGVASVVKDAVSVYPNPFVDVLKISDVKNVKSISVSDISGRQVKTLAPAAELHLSSLKSGLYIVNLHMNDGTVKSVKAIKK